MTTTNIYGVGNPGSGNNLIHTGSYHKTFDAGDVSDIIAGDGSSLELYEVQRLVEASNFTTNDSQYIVDNSQLTSYQEFDHQESDLAKFYLWGKDSTFDRNQSTYVLTHGWQSSIDVWQDVTQSIQDYDANANIILTDWSDLADNLNYSKSADDTALVGKELGEFLRDLGVDSDSTTLIGHSLGAHISGIAGDTYDCLTGSNLSTVIGLDPAGPLFENGLKEDSEQLDATDADRVVALHSSSTLGYDDPLGDLDVYLNWDSLFQPGESSVIGNHSYPIDLLADLYQGISYAQDDGSIFERDDLFSLIGSQDISTETIV